MAKMLGLMMVTRTSDDKHQVVIISPEDSMFFVPSEAFDAETIEAAKKLESPSVIGALGAIFQTEA